MHLGLQQFNKHTFMKYLGPLFHHVKANCRTFGYRENYELRFLTFSKFCEVRLFVAFDAFSEPSAMLERKYEITFSNSLPNNNINISYYVTTHTVLCTGMQLLNRNEVF